MAEVLLEREGHHTLRRRKKDVNCASALRQAAVQEWPDAIPANASLMMLERHGAWVE
eukprot:gene3247-7409_t